MVGEGHVIQLKLRLRAKDLRVDPLSFHCRKTVTDSGAKKADGVPHLAEPAKVC